MVREVSSEEFKRSLEPGYVQAPKMSAQGGALPPVQSLVEPRHFHLYHQKRFELFSGIFLLLFLIFIFIVAAKVNTNPFVVLVSLSAVLFSIITALLIYETHVVRNTYVLWVVPIVFIFLIHLFTKVAGGIFAPVKSDVMSVVSLLLCYVYVVLVHLITQSPAKAVPGASEPKNITEYIVSIEDKSKALNFVIGRVYNAFHGGTKALRERINMKTEWYDEFSQVDPSNVDFSSLLKVIDKIEAQLKNLYRTEKEVFGLEHKNFKNLSRKEDGSGRVLDVLDMNDKDPVTSYVEGALQFCKQLRDFALVQKAPRVKNEYVEKS